MAGLLSCQCANIVYEVHGLVLIIQKFAFQAELGDVVYVELPEVGSEVTSGETFGVVESVKVS